MNASACSEVLLYSNVSGAKEWPKRAQPSSMFKFKLNRQPYIEVACGRQQSPPGSVWAQGFTDVLGDRWSGLSTWTRRAAWRPTRVAIFCPRRTIFFKIAMKGTWRRPEATHSQKYFQVPQRVASDKEYVLSSVLDQ